MQGVRHPERITVSLKADMYEKAKRIADSKAMPFASFVRMVLAEHLQSRVSDTSCKA